jgi:hypothetical protein
MHDRHRAEERTEMAAIEARLSKDVTELRKVLDALAGRTDDLEQWRDRWLGPMIAFLVVLQVTSIVVGVFAVLR